MVNICGQSIDVLEYNLKYLDICRFWSLCRSDRVQTFDLASLKFCQTCWGHCVIITSRQKREETLNLKSCNSFNWIILKRSEILPLHCSALCHHQVRQKREEKANLTKISTQKITWKSLKRSKILLNCSKSVIITLGKKEGKR